MLSELVRNMVVGTGRKPAERGGISVEMNHHFTSRDGVLGNERGGTDWKAAERTECETYD